MSGGDLTYQGIKRISWLPERDTAQNGTIIGGQEYDNVEFVGGSISGLNITDPTFASPNAVLNQLLPSQTGNSGKVLKTNGTNTSWSADIDTGITQLTGDVTAGPGNGSQAATLATVNGNVGSFGSSTSIPTFTVNAKGLITAASGNAVVAPAGTLTGTTLNSTVVTSSLTSVGTISTGVWNGTSIDVAHGGTGQSSYAVGDILYASGTTTLSKLADVATGNALISGGVTTAPSWGKIGLTTHVSGTLAEGNGGTNQTTYATGDLLYASGSNTLAKRTIGNSGDLLTVSGGVPTWAASTIPVAASQADQETATSTTTYVSPGRQQFHPSACKCWAYVVGAGTSVSASYNLTSWTDSGTGSGAAVIATDFSSATYACVVGSDVTGGSSVLNRVDPTTTAQAAGQVGIFSRNNAGTAVDPNFYHIAMFGDQ